MTEDAPQRDHRLREVFNGLRWIVRAGAAWRMMPHDLPPWHTVYQQSQRGFKAGVFDTHTKHPSQGKANGAGEQTEQPLSTAIRIDLDELLIGATAQLLQIESGDTIFIPEAAYFFVYGEVERPGRYRLKQGMTAIQVVSSAGGYTAYAAGKASQSVSATTSIMTGVAAICVCGGLSGTWPKSRPKSTGCTCTIGCSRRMCWWCQHTLGCNRITTAWPTSPRSSHLFPTRCAGHRQPLFVLPSCCLQ